MSNTVLVTSVPQITEYYTSNKTISNIFTIVEWLRYGMTSHAVGWPPMQSDDLPCSRMTSHAVRWPPMQSDDLPCSLRYPMQSDDLPCSQMTSHAVRWSLIQSDDLPCSRMTSHAVRWPPMQSHAALSSVGPSSANVRNVRLYYPYIGSTLTFLYFDLYLNTAYAAHYVYL